MNRDFLALDETWDGYFALADGAVLTSLQPAINALVVEDVPIVAGKLNNLIIWLVILIADAANAVRLQHTHVFKPVLYAPKEASPLLSVLLLFHLIELTIAPMFEVDLTKGCGEEPKGKVHDEPGEVGREH